MLQWKARFSSDTLLLPFLRMWQESTHEDVLVLPLHNQISKGTGVAVSPKQMWKADSAVSPEHRGHRGGASGGRSSPCWPLPGSGKCRTPWHPHFICSTNCPQPIFNLGVAAKTPRPSSGRQSLVCLLCGWVVCCGGFLFCLSCLVLEVFWACLGLGSRWCTIQLADLSAVPFSFFLLGS